MDRLSEQELRDLLEAALDRTAGPVDRANAIRMLTEGLQALSYKLWSEQEPTYHYGGEPLDWAEEEAAWQAEEEGGDAIDQR